MINKFCGYKITFLIGSLSGGGAERVTCNLANYLCKNGYNVDVITLSNKNDTYKLDSMVERICLLDENERGNKVHNLFLKWKRLKQYVLENKNVSCYITMLPISAFMLTKLRNSIKSKIIVSDRVNPASYNCISKIMMNYAIKRCDGLVVQTKDIYNYYKHIENRIIIPNAINNDAIFQKSKKIDRKIVAVGRLNKQKNYPMLIKSFNEFSKKHPDYVLEIYGDGSEKKSLNRIVSRYRLDDKIKFMGYVSDVQKRISSAACFVMSSNYEGMSNALIEAMCMGLPCVVTDCDGGGARELISNNENGILIKKGAVDEMVLGICRIVEDKRFSNKISKNARKLSFALKPETIYQKWQKYIEGCMRNE